MAQRGLCLQVQAASDSLKLGLLIGQVIVLGASYCQGSPTSDPELASTGISPGPLLWQSLRGHLGVGIPQACLGSWCCKENGLPQERQATSTQGRKLPFLHCDLLPALTWPPVRTVRTIQPADIGHIWLPLTGHGREIRRAPRCSPRGV